MFSNVVLAVLWLVVAWRLPTAWQAPWKRAPWSALAALAVALTAGTAPTAGWLDHWVGVSDVSTLIKHVAGVIAAASFLHWLDALADPSQTRRARVRPLVTSAVVTAMIGLFVIMPRPESADWTLGVTDGAGAAYLMLMYAYLGVALGMASRVFWRASHMPMGALRCGLWMLAAGTACSTIYAGYMSLSLVLRMTGAVTIAAGRQLLAFGAVPQDLAIALILAGLSVPAAAVAWQAVEDLRSLRALKGLWISLVSAVPDVTTGPVRRGLASVFGAPRVRLIRRVAECRDVALALRCYVPPETIDAAKGKLAAAGITGKRLEAEVEACWLDLATRALASGAAPEHPAHVFPGGDTLQSEVQWLRQVAAAVRSGPALKVAGELAEGPAARQEGLNR